MNVLLNIFARLFNSPKTTAGGVLTGSAFAMAVAAIIDQAGCQFSNVQWFEIIGIVFGGPAAIGALSTDNGKVVQPVSSITGDGIRGIAIFILGVLGATLLVACSTVASLGDGRYAVTRTSEVRSPFGTNMGWTKLENCAGTYKAGENGVKDWEYSDCKPLSNWTPLGSQGQGGQIVGGALTGLGFGLGSAFSGAGGVSSSSSSSSSASSAAGGGGHH